jgi:hypothetical protein
MNDGLHQTKLKRETIRGPDVIQERKIEIPKSAPQGGEVLPLGINEVLETEKLQRTVRHPNPGTASSQDQETAEAQDPETADHQGPRIVKAQDPEIVGYQNQKIESQEIAEPLDLEIAKFLGQGIEGYLGIVEVQGTEE